MDNFHKFCINNADWLTDGFLGQYAEIYFKHFEERKYAESTVRNYLSSIAHFSQWATGKQLQLHQVNESIVAEFLDKHLPNCCCIKPVCRTYNVLRAALGHLLTVLRAHSVIEPPPISSQPVDIELRRYDRYMRDVRGLATNTRSIILLIVGRLLRSHFCDDEIDLAKITVEHVRQFYAQQIELYSKPANAAGQVISSLRSYFRYRTSLGDTVQGLTGSLSYPANWQLSSLPKTLSNEEVDQLINSLGKPCHAMRRSDAILRCALDLGLRSGEIANLSLEDINWHNGTIILRHTKGQREDVMPLPRSTGEAIAAYLQHERPTTTSRSIFMRLVAPRDQPVGPHLIRKTIRQAYARAGLPYTGSHLLRHTMASRLLASGSSIKEVADVLRHQSLNTTLIYAKLDSRKLVEVALPWPGNKS
ncbi:MAG: tyrosine-type recombinase/integrase [Chloroflexi bacterium]|jgi:site-specific recombinase XerD|nr:tyrosine-type recombinase/integrase [Gammaproteobacteria bacterium]MBT7082322.1 tyrosine-type recombinase/integrase [Chloroflexota bacterium]